MMRCLCKLVLLQFKNSLDCVAFDYSTMCVNMATFNLYWEKYRYLSRLEVVEERREILRLMNSDAFFPLDWWPEDMKFLFWKKPIGDLDMFKLVLFLLFPRSVYKLILLSESWPMCQAAEKRARQVDFLLNNQDTKSHTWFYYDIDHQKLLFLDGLPRKESRT